MIFTDPSMRKYTRRVKLLCRFLWCEEKPGIFRYSGLLMV